MQHFTQNSISRWSYHTPWVLARSLACSPTACPPRHSSGRSLTYLQTRSLPSFERPSNPSEALRIERFLSSAWTTGPLHALAGTVAAGRAHSSSGCTSKEPDPHVFAAIALPLRNSSQHWGVWILYPYECFYSCSPILLCGCVGLLMARIKDQGSTSQYLLFAESDLRRGTICIERDDQRFRHIAHRFLLTHSGFESAHGTPFASWVAVIRCSKINISTRIHYRYRYSQRSNLAITWRHGDLTQWC